jgi:hypothetical protein
MHFAADLDQAPEGNVLCALSFEKVLNPSHYLSRLLTASQALRNVLDLLHQEQDTFNRYFHSHPSIREPVETALRGIIPPVPPFSPAATPCLDEDEVEALSPYSAEQTPQQEELDGTGRYGSEQGYIPYTSFSIDDNVQGDSRPDNTVGKQHSIRESVYTSVTLPEGEPTSTVPEHDMILTYTPVQADPGHVDDHRDSVKLAKAGAGVDTGVEQAGHDADQEEASNGEFDDLPTVGDG